MIQVYIIKKSHTRTGGPNYKLLIPGIRGPVKGLRQHKEAFTYGIVSYNLRGDLSSYVFKGQDIVIYDTDGNVK
jgi:hypothetical protein